MYKSMVRWMIRRNVEALNAGDLDPVLAGFADDAVLVFPGHSSWGQEYRGKAAIEGFVRRFAQARLVGTPDEILVNGPPWRTTVCVVFSDQATDGAGAIVYRNSSPGPGGGRSATKRTSWTPRRSRPSTPFWPRANPPAGPEKTRTTPCVATSYVVLLEHEPKATTDRSPAVQ
jgi:ketosteroid isomerase-like protein